MTVKDELHQLIDTLDEDAAAEALSFVRVLVIEQETERTEEVAAPNEGLDEETAAILARAKPITADDPLWDIVGMVGDEYTGPTDVASNKHKYLAEAYADLHEE